MKTSSDQSLLQHLRQSLNPAQLDAVTYTGGPLLVLAGAGSGKTRVITYRIAYLISEKNLAPWNLLAVTFTNKAANEMKERVAQLLQGSVRGMWIGTFHSLCSRMLRSDGKAAGIDPNFVVYDRADQLAAVKQAMAAAEINTQEVKPNTVLNRISKAKSDFIWPEQMEAQANDYVGHLVVRIYKQYQKILRANRALDFDDLLIETVRMFLDHPEVADIYRKRFQHILVDEYQDTNHPQYLFLRELTRNNQNICAVGDDDQSIYSWRGATIRNILEFERDYPHVHTVRLEQNYRSTKTILAAATQLIQNNEGRHGKTLWCEGEQGDKIGLVRLPDGHSEAYWVCGEIQRLHQEAGTAYKDQAIFYRVNAQSRLFEEECIKRGIPYTVVGGTAFYERKEIKDILAYARLLLNPNDLVSFQRIINEPKRKLGPQSVQKLQSFASHTNLPVLEAARRLGDAGNASDMSAAGCSAFAAFAGMFFRWHKKSAELSLAQLLDAVYIESGYKAMLETDRDPQNLARVENIKELVSAAADFEERQKKETGAPIGSLACLGAFLENVALISDLDQMQESEDRIVLMTIHSAKGLEFPYVFLTGMEDGLFPHVNSMDSKQELEEERRLCYVGITRAKVHLYLTHAEQRRLYSQYERAVPSRFLKEIPTECVERISWGKALYERYSEGDRDDNFTIEDEVIAPRTPAPKPELEAGDMVSHRSFGFGVVLAVEGSGGKAHIVVDFQNFGKKTLIQEYANLRKV